MGRQLILTLLCALALAAQAAAEPLRAQRIAPGVHVFIGATADAAPDNAGRVGNLGVIIGTRGSLVIGTGSSNAHGEALLAAVARLSGKPVMLAVDTHAAPEHVLGNGAFSRRAIPIFAHREIDTFMAAHCDDCMKGLAESVGTAVLAGTQPVRPTQVIDGSTSIDLGGRIVDLIWFGGGPQPGGLAVFDHRSRVLFAGVLAAFGVVPDAHDADIDIWLAHLRAMRELRPTVVVPARGRPGSSARLDEVADYLTALQREARAAYDGGVPLGAAPENARLPRFASWALYGTRHDRNVHFEYLRCEARDLGASPPGAATPAPARID